MKQIIQSYRTGKLEISELPPPALKSDGLLMRTSCSVISIGTEKMILELSRASLLSKARMRPDLVKKVLDKTRQEGLLNTFNKVQTALDKPVPLGYSCAGITLDVGARCEGFKKGDRVACGGAGYANHAEFNYVPKNLCVKIPEGVSDEQAAFVTIGSIALQGVRQSGAVLGDRVVVIGLGMIGLIAVQILRSSGCFVIGYDLDPSKCELARSMGADIACSNREALLSAVEDMTSGNGADSVVICASTPGNDPIELAGEITRLRGIVVALGAIGMNIPRNVYYQKELSVKLSMSYGPGRYDPSYEERGIDYPYSDVRWTENRNMLSFMELIAKGSVNLDPIITHRFPFDEAEKAYTLIEKKSDEQVLGIILKYKETPDPSFAAARSFGTGTRAKLSGGVSAGFIGAGNFATGVLLPKLVPMKNVALHTVATSTGISASSVAKKFGFAGFSTNLNEVLDNSEINTVFILTRHSSHSKFIIEGLRAGKAVFVEKPLCVTPEQLDEITGFLSAADQNAARLTVGFNRRFSPHTAFLKERFSAVGSPVVINYRINAGRLPQGSWLLDPAEGGRVVGEMCHFVNFALFFAGAAPETVFAASGGGASPDENVSASIRFSDGSIANISYIVDGPSSLPKEQIEIIGGGASGHIHDFRKTIFRRRKSESFTTRGQDKGFSDELSAFIGSIEKGLPNPIPIEELVLTTRVIFKILDSLRSGETVRV